MATIMCPRTSCLRTFAQSSRVFSTPAPAKASFTTSTRPLKQLRLSAETTLRASPFTPRTAPRSLIPTQSSLFIRKASTSTSTIHSSSTSSSTIPDNLLTWDRFFDLRRKRRFINLGASVVTALVTVGVGAPIIADNDIDSWGAQMSGLDPFIVLGMTTFTVAAAGWMCGPTFGSAGFGLWAGRRGWNKAIAEKEKSFYARIKRYRADPASSSPQNPIPDYYGEKVASVKDYRRWLKDQRAFNRKKSRSFV